MGIFDRIADPVVRKPGKASRDRAVELLYLKVERMDLRFCGILQCFSFRVGTETNMRIVSWLVRVVPILLTRRSADMMPTQTVHILLYRVFAEGLAMESFLVKPYKAGDGGISIFVNP